ncbi:hypothetical protein TomTYG75_10340 [Sphingobium sp. TomTYG75]
MTGMAAMTGDDHPLVIDYDRIGEAELADRGGDLLDLLLTVCTGIAFRGPDRRERTQFHLEETDHSVLPDISIVIHGYATLEWVDWFNHRRLLEPIGNIPPAEAEDQYYAAADNIGRAA